MAFAAHDEDSWEPCARRERERPALGHAPVDGGRDGAPFHQGFLGVEEGEVGAEDAVAQAGAIEARLWR
jgi:hypothetical protein